MILPHRHDLAAVLLIAAVSPAQIFTADAGVASPELPSIREILTTLHTTALDGARASTDLTYSPRTDLELRLRIPVEYRRLHFTDPGTGGRVDGSLFGLRDIDLRAKYALLREDDVMYSDRLSLLAELTFPTGDHHERVDGVRLPRRLQLGLGSFGVGIGPAFTIVRDRHRASLELGYRFWATHDGFEPGDALYGNAAYWFRLSPARFDPRTPEPEYRLVTEVLTTHRFDDEQDGVDLRNGGTEIWGVLGLQVNLTPKQRIEVGARVPFLDEMDDVLGTRKLGVALSMKFYF